MSPDRLSLARRNSEWIGNVHLLGGLKCVP
jgi:hypothetical protein